MCSSTSYIKRGKGSNILMYVAIHPQHQTYKQTLLCGFFLYHPEFKGTHAEGAGEAQCGIHGDHYSRVTTAAGWRRGRFFFFFLLHHTCVVTRVITTRQTEWDYFWLCAYSIFPSDFLLLHSSPLSLCLTPCHPVSPALGFFFFFLVAVVTSTLCSVHHRAPCSTTDSNIMYWQPSTLSLVASC